MKKSAAIIKNLSLIISIICFAYFVFLEIKLGIGTKFNYFWLFLFIFFLALYLLFKFAYTSMIKLPYPIKLILEIVVLIGLFLFIMIETFIIIGTKNNTDSEADYIIVLGAKVNGTNPSLILYYRLDAAYDYLIKNPNTKVIVSGGKGYDEDISEALAMYNTLVEKGICPDRIILEEASTNTYENLKYSYEFIESNDIVGIISSDFHVYRATQIAKKQGYSQVFGIKAKSVWYLIPTNYAREFIGVTKDFIFGKMDLK